MAIRTTGLASGLDTERIVKELMSAKSLKKTKIENSKTKLEWKQDKWAELNTKLYKLYTEQVSKLRLQATYNAKKASSSNEVKAGVTASPTATNGSYTLKIDQVATTQYLTGGKIDDSAITGGVALTTKLTDLDSSLLNQEITFKGKDKESAFQIRSDSTINDLLNAAKGAGLNASFDATQKRLFISSKESGADQGFSLTSATLSSEEVTARADIEAVVDYSKLGSASKTLVDSVYSKLNEAYEKFKTEHASMSEEEQLTGFQATKDYTSAVETLADVAYTQKTASITAAATNVLKARLYTENVDTIKEEQLKKFYDVNEETGEKTVKEAYSTKFGKAYDALSEEKKAELGQSKEEYIEAQTTAAYDKAVDTETVSKVNTLVAKDADTKTRLAALETSGLDNLDEFSEEMKTKYSLTTFDSMESISKEGYASTLSGLVNTYLGVDVHSTTDASTISKLGLGNVTVDGTGNVVSTGGPSDMALIGASDSKFTLNGAQMTSGNASVSVNGLTIDLKATTAADETITFTVSNDSSGIYDTIKNFVTEYNTIMKEMNTKYNASSAKGYDVLTDEEKESMTDDQVKLWEDKIKDSLLRNDSTLSGIMSGMRSSLQASVEVDGKKYSLASFGIMTSTNYTEGGQLHIYGDSTDSTYSEYKDKLKSAIESDPDLVANVLSKIGQNLYSTMADKMKTSKVSSALTFYNDKQIKSDLETYQDQIDDWTDRLQDMEDDYYAQFTAMEKAMAKLNAQSNYLSGLFNSGS